MPHRQTPSTGHMVAAKAVLAEDRATQVEHLTLQALRRFRPAGPEADYRIPAKALAVELTSVAGVVPTAALVRSVLESTLGVDRSAGRIADYLRGFMPGSD